MWKWDIRLRKVVLFFAWLITSALDITIGITKVCSSFLFYCFHNDKHKSEDEYRKSFIQNSIINEGYLVFPLIVCKKARTKLYFSYDNNFSPPMRVDIRKIWESEKRAILSREFVLLDNSKKSKFRLHVNYLFCKVLCI